MSKVDLGQCCLVGLGGHAKTKLAPALEESGWRISAVVSSTVAKFGDATVYRCLDAALDILSRDTLFVVASPPAVHFKQVVSILKGGFDVMVEKPAFLDAADVEIVRQIADRRSLMLVEMFMYLESEIVMQALDLLVTEQTRIRRVSMNFTLPSLPSGTFRTSAGLANSLLADVGCYPLSFLARAGLPLDVLQAGYGPAAASGLPAYSIGGEIAGLQIAAQVGGADSYANCLRFEFGDGSAWTVEPFFFGRPGPRTVRREMADTTPPTAASAVLNESNAFVRMFSHPRSHWISTQNARLSEMSRVADALSRFGQSLGL